MAAVSGAAIARHNGFGLKDTVLAVVGMRKFERSLLINILLVLTLTLPLGLMIWLNPPCPA